MLNERFFKKMAKEVKSYEDELLDNPKYVDDWLEYDDKNLSARIISNDHINKALPNEVKAQELYDRYEEGEKLTDKEIDFMQKYY